MRRCSPCGRCEREIEALPRRTGAAPGWCRSLSSGWAISAAVGRWEEADRFPGRTEGHYLAVLGYAALALDSSGNTRGTWSWRGPALRRVPPERNGAGVCGSRHPYPGSEGQLEPQPQRPLRAEGHRK